jgi:DNA-binding Lrp family transcriptional regulator
MSARNFFENFFVIAPRSALKKEVGNQAAAISMNIATSHAEGVYMDPMQALVDPAFFTNQDLQKRITQNIDAQVAGIANFGTTGQVPEEILRQLEEQSSLDTSLLDPSAQASALRNRAEAREISNLLKSNVDPRQIPGLVNRVRNHYAIKAFREKGTSVDVLVPDAYRYQITTRGASGIRPNNMSSSGISQVPVAQGRSLNFVEFAVRGRQAVVSDNNASTYKAALGTFDLDDKVLPVMRTFKDENGRTRIGYITTRDPKGTQEMILMRPVMRDLETIQELAGASDDVLLSRFRSMGTIDLSRISQELSQANIGSSDMQNALGIIQGALKANKKGELFSSSGVQRGLNKASEDTMFAIETILRIVREGKYDPSAPSLLPEIPTSVIDELTLRGSAAIRGRDVLASSGRTVAQELGLGPEQGAPYSYKTFVEGQFSGQTDIATVRRFLDQVNSQLPPGMPRLTDGELGDFFSGDMAGVALRRRLGVTLDQATAIGSRVLFEANFLESLGAVGDVQNSIGMNINRMSSVSYLAPQLDDFSRQLSTMAPVGIPADLMTNILQESSTSRSFIAIAPSDIVDVINQLSGEQRIAPLSEKIAGLSPDQAARTRAGYEALAKQVGGATADTLHDFSIKPVNIALAQMEQQFAQLGTQRALGIAAGLSAEQLPGFDPSILNAGFGRMKSNDDIALLKRSVLQEQKRVRDRLLSSGVDASVVSRLDAEISSLERANSQQVRDILSLSNTSDFYRKYGSYSQAMDMGMFARGQIDTATATSFRMSDVLTRPVAKSEFVSKARALLESSKIKSLFNELEKYDSLGDKDTLQLDQNTIRTTIKYELGEELSKGLRAIRESYPGSSGKTLDIIETLNAEIVRTHGARYSSLLSYPGEEGAETTMMTLFELSKRRRLLMNQSYDARNLNYIQEAYRATINPVGDVTELSPQAARRILEAHTPDTVSIMGIEDVVNPRKIRDQNLLDFIEIIAESDNGLKVVGSRVNATRVAQEAYGMISRRTGLEAIDEEMSALGEVPATTSDGYAREVTSLMDEIERLEDESNPMLGEFFNAAKSPYRRIIDSFKDSDSALRQFIDSPGVKKFGIAMGATIAASFFYQSRKQKDLTSDSISGPPLLPGGNPYETEYPTRQSIIQDLNSNSQYSSGTQYQINTSGSMEDLNRLRGLFGDVIDGPINATMYDGLPMAGQDPYPDLASRF